MALRADLPLGFLKLLKMMISPSTRVCASTFSELTIQARAAEPGRTDLIAAQRRERHCLQVPKGRRCFKILSDWSQPPQRRMFGFGPSLVSKDQSRSFNPALTRLPGYPFTGRCLADFAQRAERRSTLRDGKNLYCTNARLDPGRRLSLRCLTQRKVNGLGQLRLRSHSALLPDRTACSGGQLCGPNRPGTPATDFFRCEKNCGCSETDYPVA